ncbi:MAG: type II secretion system F family protein [Planctomycetaceae bacterium]|jgi:type II secretory pathway component PulF|nr:type II secretion system F family protein [Planctomycetaceae bacterium]
MFSSFRFIIRFIFLGIPLFLIGVVLVFFLWPPLLVLLPFTIVFWGAFRIRRQHMVWTLIQTALETETPIHEVLYAYASTCWGPWYRAKVILFADKIQAGYAIEETAAAVKGVLRYDMVGLLKLGGSQLSGKLLTPTATDLWQNGLILEESISRIYWYYWYLPFIIPIVSFYMIAIMPKMQMVYRDFGMPLPYVTTFVIKLSQIFINYFYLFLPLLFIVLLIPVFYFILRLGIISWRPLGMRRIVRIRDSAQFLRLFAAGLELKQPIEEIIAVYSLVVPSSYLRRLGKHFNEKIAQGANWIETLRKMYWLSRGEAALLESAVRTNHVEAMLREVANSKEQRQRTTDNITIQIFSVLCIVVFGLFSGLFAVAFFIPLVHLITALAS